MGGTRSSSGTGPGSIHLRHLLVATDFSKSADLAIERAVELARAFEARLTICHVVTLEPIAPGSAELAVLPADFQERVVAASRDVLAGIVDRTRRQGVESDARIEVGPAAESVLDAASACEADLIVLSTRGSSAFSQLVWGSTAARIARHASVPILTVHPADDKAIDRIGRILIPTDFSPPALRAAEATAALFREQSAEIQLVLFHAYELPVALAPLGTRFALRSAVVRDALERADRALDQQAVALRELGFKVDTRVEKGDAAKQIGECASRLGVQLIAMATRGRSGLRHVLLGSTAERVVQHAPCPVLTLPSSEGPSSES